MTQKEFNAAVKVNQKIKLFGIKSIGDVVLMAHLERIKKGHKLIDMSEETKEVEAEIKRRVNEKA